MFGVELNDAQRAAATHGDGPLLIVAGAGTGKTMTLASRVAWLLSEGVSPDRLLLLTFSRRSAREMLSRAERMVDGGRTRAGSGAARSMPSPTDSCDRMAAHSACGPTSRCWTRPMAPTS